MTCTWRDISYLEHGTPRQRLAYSCLTGLKILDALKQFDPILVSTVCLDIDTPASDLDIICEAHDPELFHAIVAKYFGTYSRFNVRRSESDPSAVVCQFFTDDFEVEIFAHNVPTEQQNAYRHLIQINRVVTLGGAAVREAVRNLKLAGIKTEPAIARILALEGDPYKAVLDLEHRSDGDIINRFAVWETCRT